MLGNNIKNLREKMKLGINETARRAGISPSYLSDIEKGNKTNPSIEVIQKIASALNVNTEEIFKTESVTDEKLKEWDNKYNKDGKLAKEVKSIENAERIAPTLDSIPIKFTNPQDARAYISMHQIFGSDGFDADDLSDDEILEFANELLRQMNLISFKYRK